MTKRIGSVPYLNSAPLTFGIEEKIQFLPPFQLAKRLRSGEFAAGLVSITEVLYNNLYDILDGVAVACDGAVKSVFLAHKKPLDEIEVIYCDAASLSSVNLLKVILKDYGLSPRLEPFDNYLQAEEQNAVLLIGNPGIEFLKRHHEHQILDLGQAWKDLTGLPFVFAVWAIRRDQSNSELRQMLMKAKEKGTGKLTDIIKNHSDFDFELRDLYFRKHIRFELTNHEKKGILEFVRRLREVVGEPIFIPNYVSAN